MIIDTLSPIAFSIFGLDIRYYGLVYAFAFLIGYAYFNYVRKNGALKNLDYDGLLDLILVIIISVVIGARLGLVIFYHPSYFFHNPLEIFKLWKGGMSFHGAVIGLIIGFSLFAKKKKLSFLELFDYAVIPATFSLSIGRIANFINAELYGIPTNLPWGVLFPGVSGARHPTQIYESICYFILFIILFFMSRKKLLLLSQGVKQNTLGYFSQVGVSTYLFLIIYGISRFIIEFWKDLDIILGLRIGQWLCLFMIFAGAFGLFVQYKKYKNNKN